MCCVAAPDPDADWWTVEDVAAYLGVARNTVHAYRSRAQMPAPEHQYGQTRLWRPATITGWQAGRKARSKP